MDPPPKSHGYDIVVAVLVVRLSRRCSGKRQEHMASMLFTSLFSPHINIFDQNDL